MGRQAEQGRGRHVEHDRGNKTVGTGQEGRQAKQGRGRQAEQGRGRQVEHGRGNKAGGKGQGEYKAGGTGQAEQSGGIGRGKKALNTRKSSADIIILLQV
jgi:hypothetical protein